LIGWAGETDLRETTIMIADLHTGREPLAVVRRLQAATNAHDLDALVDCFTADYLSEIPLHPSRGFRGGEQVRRNWAQILGGVPDLHSELIREAVVDNVVWAEWEWTGTRRDGAAHLMRGTTILGVEGERIAWARFYMEPVVDDGVRIEAAVAQTVAPASDR
jgi:ketosteroid isomerase-like protein